MRVTSKSYKDTLKLGRIIAGRIKPADIICLFGQLGAGKTVLVKGIAEGLGIKRGEVVSPSFILMRLHKKGKIPLYHFDLYRLNNAQDILGLGYEEYLYGNGVAVIEWADRLKYLLPKEFIKVELYIKAERQRALKFSAFGRRYSAVLENIYEDIRH